MKGTAVEAKEWEEVSVLQVEGDGYLIDDPMRQVSFSKLDADVVDTTVSWPLDRFKRPTGIRRTLGKVAKDSAVGDLEPADVANLVTEFQKSPETIVVAGRPQPLDAGVATGRPRPPLRRPTPLVVPVGDVSSGAPAERDEGGNGLKAFTPREDYLFVKVCGSTGIGLIFDDL